MASVRGEIDADNCDELSSAILGATVETELLALDAAGLTFIDSSGISELLRIHESVTAQGKQFELRDPSPAVRRVLEITGLLGHFGLS